MCLTITKIHETVLVQPKKTVVGIITPQVRQRQNRAIFARFSYGFGRSGPLRRAVLFGGGDNPVRPAHPRLSPWQADIAERKQRSNMPNKTEEFPLYTPCGPEKIVGGHINCVLAREPMLTERYGPMFQPFYYHLRQAMKALGEIEPPDHPNHFESVLCGGQ